MPGRNFNASNYRFGFNGKEKDDEITGSTGSHYTAEYWEYDSRICRRWNPDPISYACQSTYACFNNNPIYFKDPSGLQGSGPDDPPTGKKLSEPNITEGVYQLREVSITAKGPSFWSKVGDFFNKVVSLIVSWLNAADRWVTGTNTYNQEGGYHFYSKTGGGNFENAKASAHSDVQMVESDMLLLMLGNAGAGPKEFGSGTINIAEGVGKTSELIQETVEAEKPSISVPNSNSIQQSVEQKTIILHLNIDSSSVAPFEVENNAINRDLGKRDGFRWLREVKGKTTIK